MDYPQALVSIVMLCVCVLLGVPVWWNTTKVYRATLPHSRIEELQETAVTLTVKLQLIAEKEILMNIEQLDNFLKQYPSFQFDIINSTKIPDLLERDQTLNGFCNLMHEKEEPTRLQINIILVKSDKETFQYCCQSGVSFVISATNLTHALKSLLREILPLEEVASQKLQQKTDVTKSLQLSTGYNIVFTLALAYPSMFIPRWNIENSIRNYLEPMLEELDFLGPFQISSQVLYFADLGVTPRKAIDNDNVTYFYYENSKLPLIMNPIESRLNTYTSTNAGLNFIVYIPAPQYTPLYIKLKKGTSKLSKAFHSPRWGGIQIHNHKENSTFVNTEDYMKTFLTQFQLLNGLDPESTFQFFNRNTRDLITKSKRNRLLIRKIFEHVQTSISTLSSLSKLLDNIANIVIRDEIKVLIETSILHIEECSKKLLEGDLLSAMNSSKVAFECSEKAFYDWSLLALLYFPDDQKYAIYVPLFLPISLPLFLSFFKSVRWLRSKGV